MRISPVQQARHGARIVHQRLRPGPVAAHLGVAEAALIGREHRDAVGGKLGGGIFPGVAAVVHPVQRQHHRPGIAIRQPGPVGQARAVLHHEGIGRLRGGALPGPADQVSAQPPSPSVTASSAVSSRRPQQGHARTHAMERRNQRARCVFSLPPWSSIDLSGLRVTRAIPRREG